MDTPHTESVFRGLRDPAVRHAARFGARAATLSRLAIAGLPVPPAIVLPPEVTAGFAAGGAPDAGLEAVLEALGADALIALRGSPPSRDWGGPRAILNIGLTDATVETLAGRIGERAAWDLYRRLIQSWGAGVAGLDEELFENALYDRLKLAGVEGEEALDAGQLRALVADYKAIFEDEGEAPFPQDASDQLAAALGAAAAAWQRPAARMMRAARGAPEDAPLALIVQRMALGLGPGCSGAGIAHFADEATGAPELWGRYLDQAQGMDALMGLRTPVLLSAAERTRLGQPGRALEEREPEVAAALRAAGEAATEALGDVHSLEFTLESGALHILDAVPARRSPRAALRIAVSLAERGTITRDAALMRIDPRVLDDHLHPQIDPAHRRDVVGRGLAASPGAASGQIVFNPEAAMTLHAQEVPCILVRIETSPEDIRGMHAAQGLITMRGGMTSHAAVIARGLGLPCVVGCGELRLDARARTVTAPDGRAFREGDVVTVDGSRGEVLAGAAPTIPPELSGVFTTLMGWAGAVRRLKVRANADTPHDARVARRFGADGIGLCRTEQMFFQADRINVMREMILADSTAARQQALDRLLPMQRSDFVELFEIMRGLPVTIRLLDPPLHEFLPVSREELRALADEMDLPVSQLIQRAEELHEFNPMLGMRGVRLAVTMPEIYQMQARAIFEATLLVEERSGMTVIPEIMIPLVSAAREVELVKSRIEAVAGEVSHEHGRALPYRLGVMVETPRAAIRAGDLARSAAFLSFGTNDLTQMTYGLSRDDAGRFMRDYVNNGVFREDPFHLLDIDGVGELVLMAAGRARETNPQVALGLCGEHGGDPESVAFCEAAGLDYVSCSPFRMPIAQLAAAQAVLRQGQVR
ncbi:MAG: pyruvate, phosphate dikinase [Alphaproteobacteria bacterium]|nr:MAG: pyruvate, phosphate dikinase [Alphaproteobacteria bacterium]